MLLREAPAVDVRPELATERRALLDLLGSLTADQWATPSAAPGWTVRDLALHLLDDDLGWLSRDRDGDTSSYLHERGPALVTALAAKNQRWIDGARGLSSRVLVDLLEWSGRQMDAYYSAMDLGGEGEVTWADADTVPVSHPAASASFSDDAGWRSLTGAGVPAGGVVLEGPTALVEPLLAVRGILV